MGATVARHRRVAPGERRVLGINLNVFVMSVTSFLTDISSEMTLTILPLFLSNVLGVKTPIIGLIEGIAESTASLLRVFSGWFSDKIGKRKTLTVMGYGLSTIAKPFLYFANAWGIVLGVRFADRVGKGIRSAPRDALLADSSLPQERGKNFGIHRAMDSAGAVVGLSAAAVVAFLLQQGALDLSRATYQTLVLVGIIPAICAVLILAGFVKEVQRAAPSGQRSVVAPSLAELVTLKGFERSFKLFMFIVALFTLGNSSDAFLILRAQNLGLNVVQIFAMLALFNVVYASIATPAGVLSDKIGRRQVIVLGWAVYGLIYLGFAVASSAWQVWLLFVLYGIYYGFAEGVTRAFVADVVPAEKRGSAYGIYHTLVGASAFPASFVAGWLWQAVAPAAPFYLGAVLAGLASVLLLSLVKR